MQKIDYTTLLASSVHEVKNSLNMLLHSVDQALLSSDINDHNNKLFSQIQYEGKRVNDDLVGLLAIYRIEHNEYFVNIDEHSVYDFLNENIKTHEPIILHKNIDERLECDINLNWYFDRDLVTGVISNIVNNLYKFTKDKLIISAAIEENYLVIRIKDNGPGYPDNMLISHEDSDQQKNICFDKANTGLGLYFSNLVAEVHRNKDRIGYITTTNEGIEGGGCFSIYLP
jgi:two-component system, OmpR family, sensor histidine kinase SenX3